MYLVDTHRKVLPEVVQALWRALIVALRLLQLEVRVELLARREPFSTLLPPQLRGLRGVQTDDGLGLLPEILELGCHRRESTPREAARDAALSPYYRRSSGVPRVVYRGSFIL